MCCSDLQSVVVFCSVLQERCKTHRARYIAEPGGARSSAVKADGAIAVECCVLQCVAVRCSVLQCVAREVQDAQGRVLALHRALSRQRELLHYVALFYSVLQCVAVCCSVLQCVAKKAKDSQGKI